MKPLPGSKISPDTYEILGRWGTFQSNLTYRRPGSKIMKSIGEAIQYLHSINIAHRDVKVCIILDI